MRELNYFKENGTEIIIGFREDDGDIQTFTKAVIDLEAIDQSKVSDFRDLFNNRLGVGETYNKSLTQITVSQHMSEERCLWYVDGDETPRFMVKNSINNTELIKYDDMRNLCETIMNNG